jgi:membrane fusion protein (multidrug efflux system)
MAGFLGRNKRYIITMIIVVVALLALMAGIVLHLFAGFAKMQAGMKNGPPPSVVSAMQATQQQWQAQVDTIGSMRAVRGVDVTTEIAGLVRSVEIKSGTAVKAGDLLVQLNIDADVAQLHALEAAADLAQTVLTRDEAQRAADAVAQATVDADRADLKSKRAQVAGQQAVIDKKTIRAPFSGKLGITQVNPGQYINPGDKIVTLQSVDPIYLDFTVPQQQLGAIAVGQTIHVSNESYPGQVFEGRVSAIDPKVDVATRNVSVEATVKNDKRLLYPGMFARATIEYGEPMSYLTLPQTAVTYNPYGATVFIAKDGGKKDADGKTVLEAQQAFVTLGPTRGDQVAILKGIDAGAMVVTSGQLKLKTGSTLRIDNSVQPANDANPTPQEK